MLTDAERHFEVLVGGCDALLEVQLGHVEAASGLFFGHGALHRSGCCTFTTDNAICGERCDLVCNRLLAGRHAPVGDAERACHIRNPDG